GHTPVCDFSRQPVAVNHYYFYVQDRDWGPAFLKIGTYLPYPVKLCSQRPRVDEAMAPAPPHSIREPRYCVSLVHQSCRPTARLRRPWPGSCPGPSRCQAVRRSAENSLVNVQNVGAHSWAFFIVVLSPATRSTSNCQSRVKRMRGAAAAGAVTAI